MTGWHHPDYRVWKVILGTWSLTDIQCGIQENAKCLMGCGIWLLYSESSIFQNLGTDALLGKKTVFRVEIEMKEVWYAGLSWKRSGNAVWGPPIPGHKTCINLKPDVSLSGHHISTSQEQSDKDIFISNCSLGQLWSYHLKLNVDMSLIYISTCFRHFFIILTSVS